MFTVEQAIAAVGAFDSRFLGYEPLDPDVIGQANYVEVREFPGRGYELTFVAGSGDCPAGCINRDYARFDVRPDGTVTLRCEWSEGDEPSGTPC